MQRPAPGAGLVDGGRLLKAATVCGGGAARAGGTRLSRLSDVFVFWRHGQNLRPPYAKQGRAWHSRSFGEQHLYTAAPALLLVSVALSLIPGSAVICRRFESSRSSARASNRAC